MSLRVRGAASALPASHFLLALAVMAVWGSNFVAIKHALGALPPLTFAALRFTIVVVPLVILLPRPKVPWRNLAAYGLLIGVGQFGLLFIAMRGDITPGLASLVIQLQVFFTIGLSMVLTREQVRGYQLIALLMSFAGIGVIAASGGGSATPLGLALVLLAALSWAGGNMVARAAGRIDMLPYVVWSSLFPVPVLFLLAYMIEGPAAIAAGIAEADLLTWGAVVWQAVGNTMFGYTAWGWLLARHPAATIAPMALLAPVFGMGTSAVVLGEPLPAWKLFAAALVISGLAIGIFWPRLRPPSPASVQ